MRSKVVLGVCLVAAVTASGAAWAKPFHLEKQFDLAPGGALYVNSEAGGVEVRGGEGDVAKVTITSGRSDFTEKFDVRLDDSRPGRLEVTVERKGSALFRANWWSGRTVVVVTVPRQTAVEARCAGASRRMSCAASSMVGVRC